MPLKKILLVPMLFMILLLMLPGCADEAEKAEKQWETHWLGAEAFSARVMARVVLDDQVQDYILSWRWSGGVYRAEILEPETLSGISITGTPSGGLEFSYNAVTLAVDPDAQVISPLEALGELLADWRGGIPESRSFSLCDGENALALDFEHPRGAVTFSQRAWFAPDTDRPIRAEAFQDGKLICVFTFSEFNFDR